MEKSGSMGRLHGHSCRGCACCAAFAVVQCWPRSWALQELAALHVIKFLTCHSPSLAPGVEPQQRHLEMLQPCGQGGKFLLLVLTQLTPEGKNMCMGSLPRLWCWGRGGNWCWAKLHLPAYSPHQHPPRYGESPVLAAGNLNYSAVSPHGSSLSNCVKRNR